MGILRLSATGSDEDAAAATVRSGSSPVAGTGRTKVAGRAPRMSRGGVSGSGHLASGPEFARRKDSVWYRAAGVERAGQGSDRSIASGRRPRSEAHAAPGDASQGARRPDHDQRAKQEQQPRHDHREIAQSHAQRGSDLQPGRLPAEEKRRRHQQPRDDTRRVLAFRGHVFPIACRDAPPPRRRRVRGLIRCCFCQQLGPAFDFGREALIECRWRCQAG